MVDITAKNHSHRSAIAQAVLQVGQESTIRAVQEQRVPKGNVFEAARVAGLFGVKRTSDLIPDCHPLPIEHTDIRFNIEGLTIVIEVEVQTIYKTGVEVEAMHGASVAALTIYDMLKPLDKEIEIQRIRLVQKKGGKTDYKDAIPTGFQAAVMVCSDSVSAGKKQDTAGKAVVKLLEQKGIEVGAYLIVSDEIDEIQNALRSCISNNYPLIILTGGTGLSRRDHTPDAIRPMLDREIPGISEAMRNYGQQRMPYAMLSRSLAGMIGQHLVVSLPGSTRGASESMAAIFPAILHVFRLKEGFQHENNAP